MSKISLKTDFADGQILYGADLANNFKVIEAGVNSTEEVLNEAIEISKDELRDELDDITANRGWDWSGANADRVTFFKGTEAEVNAQTIKNGQLLYNTETGATALDHNNKRIVTGSGNVVEINGGTTPDNVATKIWINKRKDGEIVDILNYRDNESNAWKELNLAVAGDTFPIGAIAVYPLDSAPANWLPLNGQQVSRTEYAELFAILGTKYGAGNGTTTFSLPDFRGRHVVNLDFTQSSFNQVGKTGAFNNTVNSGDSAYIVQNYIIKAKQSVGLLGNIVTDIAATGDKDVATSETVKNYVDNQITNINNTIKDKHKYYISEHIVGTWVDGRNIYRRVFMGKLSNTPVSGQSNICRTVLDQNASDLDMINAGGKVHNTSDSQINLGFEAAQYGSQVYIFQNQLLIQHTTDIVGDFMVFVEYIKKSDV